MEGQLVRQMAANRDEPFAFNLNVLKRSRKAPRAGDIFALQPVGHPYYFGRVIRTDTKIGADNSILCYIYDAPSADKANVPVLKRDRLLIPPFGTWRGSWYEGFFETVDHRELQPDDILPRHCFWSLIRHVYFDEDRNRLSEPFEPVGIFSVFTARGIDERISKALGIPRRTDTGATEKDHRSTADEQASDGDDAEQAVIVRLEPWPERRDGLPLDIMEVEDHLANAVRAADAGEYDGHGVSKDEVEFFLYGPDAERLFAAVEPVLRKWPLTGYVLKRQGPPGSRETRIEL